MRRCVEIFDDQGRVRFSLVHRGLAGRDAVRFRDVLWKTKDAAGPANKAKAESLAGANFMNYFDNCNTPSERKKRYRELAKKHHPDVGGNAKTMQEINKQYDSGEQEAPRQSSNSGWKKESDAEYWDRQKKYEDFKRRMQEELAKRRQQKAKSPQEVYEEKLKQAREELGREMARAKEEYDQKVRDARKERDMFNYESGQYFYQENVFEGKK